MNQQAMGVSLAILTSIFFALYIIPRKFSTINPYIYNLWLGVGFLASTVLLFVLQFYFYQLETLMAESVINSLPVGLLWSVGTLFLVISIDYLGLARSNQWKNLQAPIAMLLSLVLLRESLITNIPYVILGGLLIYASALLLNIKTDSTNNRTGIIYALSAALSFGLAATYSKALVDNANIYNQLMGAGIAISLISLLIAIIKAPKHIRNITKKEAKYPIIGGVGMMLAVYGMFQSYRYLPASIAYPIMQFNAVWVILIGILIFKEIEYKKHRKRIIPGIASAVIAVIILSLA